MLPNRTAVRKVSIVNFTGFRANWGCQATSWGLINLLNSGLTLEELPRLSLVPLLPRAEIDQQINNTQVDAIHEAIEEVAHGGASAGKSLDFLENLCVERYRHHALQVKGSDLVVLQAEGTMAGTDFPRGARVLLLPFVAKHAWKKPVLSLNQTLYSCDPSFTRIMAAAFNSFDLVAVRENISFDAAQTAGIDRLCLIPDAAFLTRARPNQAPLTGGPYFAVTGTAWTQDGIHDEIFRAADELKRETGLHPLVMASTGADKALLDLAERHWGQGGYDRIAPDTPHSVVADALRQCRFLLSGRYHMTIMALTVGTPTIQLPGNSYKNEGLSAMLGGLSPVRAFDDRAAISRDAAEILKNRDAQSAAVESAVDPLRDRLGEAGAFLAAIQRGAATDIPAALKIPPGLPISADDHLAAYCGNTAHQAETLGYLAKEALGKPPAPRHLFEQMVGDFHAGDRQVERSLVQMLGSFPGKVERARRDLREAIYRLPPHHFTLGYAPRPADNEAPVRTLAELDALCGTDLAAMAQRRVPGAAAAPPRPRADDIATHLATLREEFCGQLEVTFYHAALICFLRREVEVPAALERFHAVWNQQGDVLRSALDSRWLVSACDTFADHAEDPADRALAMLGSLFVNTVRLYESERWATGTRGVPQDYRAIDNTVFLHDGLSAFSIGDGDTLVNLQKRMSRLTGSPGPLSAILSELFARMHRNDTVFQRFRDVHRRQVTLWDAEL